MKLLILGYSSIVRRRVLPAARASAWIDEVEVASRQFAGGTPESLASLRTWTDYATALEHSACELVYVSLVNSAHDAWVRQALAAGRHVIVDKPALLSVALAEDAVALAARHDRVLAEATVWPYHPQVRQLLDAAGSGPRRASAIFCYPPLPATDYRWHAELGGGALWDLGPYAVSVGRVLFGAEPEAVGAHVLARARGVDTSFCMWADYGSGRGLTGLFGADVSYSNNLELLTDDTRIRIERVFTTPPELENVIDVHGPAPARLHTPAVDSFAEFLLAVGRAIAAHDHHSFASNLLADARTLARLREAAGACT